MKGFRDTTKTQQGHNFAGGGMVPKISMPKMARAAPMGRPIMPRPHVMPNIKAVSMPKVKLAKGGQPNHLNLGDRTDGNCLEQPTPYSEVEEHHPRRAARPGFKKGGGMHIKPSHKGKFTRAMGKKEGHLTDKDVSRGLHSKSGTIRKEANFARMARRHFKPLAKGGRTGTMRKIADQEIGKHVRSSPPAGHGVKSGGLAFMRKPLCEGGRSDE